MKRRGESPFGSRARRIPGLKFTPGICHFIDLLVFVAMRNTYFNSDLVSRSEFRVLEKFTD